MLNESSLILFGVAKNNFLKPPRSGQEKETEDLTVQNHTAESVVHNFMWIASVRVGVHTAFVNWYHLHCDYIRATPRATAPSLNLKWVVQGPASNGDHGLQLTLSNIPFMNLSAYSALAQGSNSAESHFPGISLLAQTGNFWKYNLVDEVTKGMINQRCFTMQTTTAKGMIL